MAQTTLFTPSSSRIIHLPVSFNSISGTVHLACGRVAAEETGVRIAYEHVAHVTCAACAKVMNNALSFELRNWSENSNEACHEQLAAELANLAVDTAEDAVRKAEEKLAAMKRTLEAMKTHRNNL